MQRSALLSLVLLGLTAPAAAQDPFAPGEVWDHHAPASDPWLPGPVHLTGRDNLTFGAVRGASPRVQAVATASSGAAEARFVEQGIHAQAQSTRTAAARSVPRGFTLDALAIPGSTARTLVLSGHELDGQHPLPGWSHVLGVAVDGSTRVAASADGRVVVAAGHTTITGLVRVEVLLGRTGALLTSVDLPGLALNDLDVSDNGTRIAVAAGLDLYVIDHLGALVHQEAVGLAPRDLALSGDGARLAIGAIGSLRVVADAPGGWIELFDLQRASNEAATCVDLDLDGSTLAAGWWDHVGGVAARLELWDVDSGALHTTQVLASSPGARQNLPEVVRLVDDGTRAAFGTWGDDVGSPEVFLIDRDGGQPPWTFDLPGSVRGLDLDATGRRVLVTYKDAHNNVFAASGGVRLFDTGEGELRQLGPAEPGASVPFATRPSTPASISLLVHGQRASAPLVIPGVPGALLVERTTAAIQAAGIQADGQATHDLVLPDDPELVGTWWVLQAVFRGPAGTRFSDDLLEALIL